MRPSGQPVLVVAFSGGRDSRVLLHAAAAVWPHHRLVAAHVHHGLQPQADAWLAFCRDTALAEGVPFRYRRLPPRRRPHPDPAAPRGPEGLEGWARRLRYQALAEIAAEAGADLVLTAHHANDQLETVQMRRLRGAGPRGLAGMRVVAPLPGSPGLLLLRPFLDIGRGSLADHAARHGLAWVDDPSNRDPRHLRNRLRAQLESAIAADAAALERGLAAIGDLQREADEIHQQALADLDGARLVVVPAPLTEGVATPAVTPRRETRSLSRAALARLTGDRANEALRAWLAELGCRMPSRAKLAEIVRQLLVVDAPHVRLQHDGRWLLRYRDRIDAAERLPEPFAATAFRWDGEPMLDVAGQRFVFSVVAAAGSGSADRSDLSVLVDLAATGTAGTGSRAPDDAPMAVLDADALRGVDLLLDRPRGGDRIRLRPGGPRRSLRNLMQERGVPPWLRPALPVLRATGAVVYAAPFGVADVAVVAPPPPLPTGEWATPGAANDPGRIAAGTRIRIDWVPPEDWRRWL